MPAVPEFSSAVIRGLGAALSCNLRHRPGKRYLANDEPLDLARGFIIKALAKLPDLTRHQLHYAVRFGDVAVDSSGSSVLENSNMFDDPRIGIEEVFEGTEGIRICSVIACGLNERKVTIEPRLAFLMLELALLSATAIGVCKSRR